MSEIKKTIYKKETTLMNGDVLVEEFGTEWDLIRNKQIPESKIVYITTGLPPSVQDIPVGYIGYGKMDSDGEYHFFVNDEDSDIIDTLMSGSNGNDPGGLYSVSSILNEVSWADIARISEADIVPNALTYQDVSIKYGWNLGDVKNVWLMGVPHPARIIGINHDNRTGGGTIGITFEFVNIIEKYQMKSTLTNIGGWKDTDMRNINLPLIMNMFSPELISVMKYADKLTANAGKSNTQILTTSDRLWLISDRELNGREVYSNIGEGRQYAYWIGKCDTNSYRVRSPVGQSAFGWWMRSPITNNDTMYAIVPSNGASSTGDANALYGASPCFGI